MWHDMAWNLSIIKYVLQYREAAKIYNFYPSSANYHCSQGRLQFQFFLEKSGELAVFGRFQSTKGTKGHL